MACDAATLETLIHADGLAKLSYLDLLMCVADQYGQRAAFANATIALAQAKANGFQKLSDRDLESAFEEAICH